MRRPRLSLKDLIRIRALNKCEKCRVKLKRSRGKPHNGSFHHRRPKRIGGPNTIPNEVLLCLDCHRDVHRDERAAASAGWIVWGDPEVCPLLLSDGRWVLLVPDGTYEPLADPEAHRLLSWVNGVDDPASPLTGWVA